MCVCVCVCVCVLSGSDCEVTIESTALLRGDRDSMGLDVDGVWINGTGQFQRGTPPDTLLELLEVFPYRYLFFFR